MPRLELLAVLPGANASLAVSGDGSHLMVRWREDETPDADSTGTLYNTTTWQAGPLFPRCGTVMALNQDGSRFASTRREDTARVVDTATGREVCKLQSGGGQNTLAFSGSGQWLATSRWDGRVALFDSATGGQQHLLDDMGGSVNTLAWLGDAFIAAGGANHAVKVWASDETPYGAAYDHTEAVNALAWYQPGSHLLTGGNDARIIFRDVFRQVSPFHVMTGISPPLLTFPGSRLIAGYQADGKLALCDPVAGKVLSACALPPGCIHLGAHAGGESALFLQIHEPSALAGFLNTNSLTLPEAARQSLRLTKSVRLLTIHARTGATQRDVLLEGAPLAPGLSAVSRDGRTAALLRDTHTAGVWDGASGALRRDLTSTAGITGLLAAPDGATLYLMTAENWSALSVNDGRVLWTAPFPHKSAPAFSTDPAMTRLALSMQDGTIELYTLQDGRRSARLTGHTSAAGACGWTPDGTRLISATATGDIRIWDVSSSREIATLGNIAGLAHHMIVTGDGRHLLMASYGAQIYTAP